MTRVDPATRPYVPVWLLAWSALVLVIGGITESVHGGAPWFAKLGEIPAAIQASRMLTLARGEQWQLADSMLERDPDLRLMRESLDRLLPVALARNELEVARNRGMQLARRAAAESGQASLQVGSRLFDAGRLRNDKQVEDAGFELVLAAAKADERDAIVWIGQHIDDPDEARPYFKRAAALGSAAASTWLDDHRKRSRSR